MKVVHEVGLLNNREIVSENDCVDQKGFQSDPTLKAAVASV